jgi:hypothetical protein
MRVTVLYLIQDIEIVCSNKSLENTGFLLRYLIGKTENITYMQNMFAIGDEPLELLMQHSVS